MKIITLLLLLFFAANLSATAKEKTLEVLLENPGLFERKSETIAIPLKELFRKLRILDAEQIGVFHADGKREILSQITLDELLFQTDLLPQEKKKFVVKRRVVPSAKPQSLVDGRFVLPREDYAWENDRIAFRMYGPALAKEVNNGIDVWCKRVRYLVVEKWYSGEADTGAAKKSYHVDHGEGADFFSVGKTLGAGSSGIWLNGKLYQPGVFSSYRTMSNGPIRVTFELTYKNWNFDGKSFTEVKRVSLDAGQNLNRIEVRFLGLAREDTLRIACGLVKREKTVFARDEKNRWVSLWGPTNNDPANGDLGTGIVIHDASTATTIEEKDQYLLLSRLIPANSFVYYTGAGWTGNGDFVSEESWKNSLNAFSQRLIVPVRVTVR